MAKGKRTCKILKEIRRQIAEANDIEYVVEECQYKGDCLGTCPKCEAEVRYLEEQLHQRQLLGKAAMVAGISAGLLTIGSCGNEMYAQVNNPKEGVVIKGGKEAIPVPHVKETEEKVFGCVEQMGSFPGGYTALAKFLEDNIKYPQSPETEGVQGRVICQFELDEKGYISDIKVAKSIHPLLDAEAVRVISIMPRWIPGEQLGVPVNVRYTLPITFRLDNDNDSTKTNSK
ncbi:MAG: energy transducer TonB [Prevotella sp.]|nr:energy transducer TonB [Prevotella sp.]